MHGLLDSEWREKLPPVCTKCSYNLTGVQSDHCPECGQPIFWYELRTNAKTTWHALRRAEDFNDVVDFGVYVIGAGFVLVMGLWIVGWGAVLGRLVGCVFGIAAMGTGLQVLKVRRVPDWAREFVTIRPNYQKCAVVIALGALLATLAVILP